MAIDIISSILAAMADCVVVVQFHVRINGCNARHGTFVKPPQGLEPSRPPKINIHDITGLIAGVV
jgi:hypothetical protein